MSSDGRESEIVDSLTSVGIDPVSITVITDSREPVYEVQSESGRYFLKFLQDEKGRAMRDVLDRDLSVGMPDSRLVGDGNYALVMDSADGWPLSLSLPVCSLPGAWWALSDSLVRSVRNVGIGLGELHSGTRIDDRRVGDDECRMADRLTIERPIRGQFRSETIAEIDRLFDELRETRLPFARIHGDPTPHNIFWDVRTGEADVIDFNLHGSVAAEDLAVFEAGIELMAARLPYARRSQAKSVIESFRSGYRESGVHDPIPERTVALVKLSYYAHLLSKYLRGASPATRREKVTQYTDRRVLERKVESLASRL